MTKLITMPRGEAAFFPKYMRSFFEDMNRDFEGVQTSTQSYVPRVDISDDANNIYVHAELPGLTKDSVKVTVTDGLLILRGEKKHEEKKEERNYFRIERRYGEFVRQFTLPDNVDEANVRANFANGILEITIPKKEPKTIIPINTFTTIIIF